MISEGQTLGWHVPPAAAGERGRHGRGLRGDPRPPGRPLRDQGVVAVDSRTTRTRSALFDREARITSLLQHPNVVQVIDHNTTDDGTAYLVMEYLSGESLARRLARVGALPVDTEVVDIVDQIAAGLAAAHAHGIVHRDLKPDNVFLVPIEGRDSDLVKILDFGISKASWGVSSPWTTGSSARPNTWRPSRSKAASPTWMRDRSVRAGGHRVRAADGLQPGHGQPHPGADRAARAARFGAGARAGQVERRAVSDGHGVRGGVPRRADAAVVVAPPVVVLAPACLSSRPRLARGRHAGRGARAGGYVSGWPSPPAWRRRCSSRWNHPPAFRVRARSGRWRRPSRSRRRLPARRARARADPGDDRRGRGRCPPAGGAAVSVACARQPARARDARRSHPPHAGAGAPARGRRGRDPADVRTVAAY